MAYVVGRKLASSMVTPDGPSWRWVCPFCKTGGPTCRGTDPWHRARMGARRHLQACKSFALVAKQRKVSS